MERKPENPEETHMFHFSYYTHNTQDCSKISEYFFITIKQSGALQKNISCSGLCYSEVQKKANLRLARNDSPGVMCA